MHQGAPNMDQGAPNMDQGAPNMDQGARNPYVPTLKLTREIETKIETLTQQVKDLTQVVSECSQKTDKLHNDYLNMKTLLKYQTEHYGLPQANLSNP